MRVIRNHLLLFCAFGGALIAPSAHAGSGTVSNGGNAIVCYSRQNPSQIESVQLFDYWEMAQVLNGPPADLGPESFDYQAKIGIFISRIEKLDPDRATNYRIAASRIINQLDKVLVDDLGSAPIDDDHSTLKPSEPCFKQQFAVQVMDPAPGESRFRILRNLWNHALSEAKAGIILHEVIYREAIKAGQRNSDGVRKTNYIIASKSRGFETVRAYEDALRPSGLEIEGNSPAIIANFQNAVIFLSGTTLEKPVELVSSPPLPPIKLTLPAGATIRGRTVQGLSYITEVIQPGVFGSVTYLGQTIRLQEDFQVYENGNLKSVFTPDEVRFAWAGNTLVCTGSDPKANSSFEFMEDGSLSYCHLKGDMTLQWQGMKLDVTSCGDKTIVDGIKINDHALQVACLAKSTPLRVAHSNKVMEFTGRIVFDPTDPSGVRHGTFKTPIVRKLLGFDVTIRDLVMNDKGQTKFYFDQFAIKDPKVRGARVLGDINTNDTINKVCTGMGFEWGWPDESERGTFHLMGTQPFYDPVGDRVVQITDDDVKVLSTAICSGTVPYEL